ncbi:MAG: hypothetical protein E7644_07520 [Ruminococcaceae bacterium]|nr:hypothetical protein [Oscillospiraceae bacterium]
MASARKLHKKTALICALILLLGLTVTLLMLDWHGTAELSDFNRHSATPTSLGKALEDASGYESVPGMMGGEQYMSSDGVSFITVAHFPDTVLGSTCTVGVRLVAGSEKYHVLGVRTGDRADTVYRALEEHRFEVTHSSASGIRAQRGRITLQFSLDENGRVTEIVANLSGTNLFRVQYKSE